MNERKIGRNRRREELPRPDLAADHEANKIQRILQARVEPEFYAAVEAFRVQNGWSKKEMFEKVFSAAMKPAP